MGALIDWGVALRAMPGQLQSGDGYVVELVPGGVLVAVIDGLGHGMEALRACQAAVAALQVRPRDDVVTLMGRCHEALRRTHGAVMSLATIDAEKRQLTWLGVGNVEGSLVRGALASRESLLLRGGVVGYQLPPLRAATLSIAPGDLLIFATDGIRSGFTRALSRYGQGLLRETPQEIADRLLAGFGKETDDSLVLAVRYLGAAP